jgi:hypothetical protein
MAPTKTKKVDKQSRNARAKRSTRNAASTDNPDSDTGFHRDVGTGSETPAARLPVSVSTQPQLAA